LTPEITNSSEDLVPYSVIIDMKVPEDLKKAFSISYSYSLWEDNTTAEWERDPARSLEVLPSENYHGQMSEKHSH
jgi:hypothetical protein